MEYQCGGGDDTTVTPWQSIRKVIRPTRVEDGESERGYVWQQNWILWQKNWKVKNLFYNFCVNDKTHRRLWSPNIPIPLKSVFGSSPWNPKRNSIFRNTKFDNQENVVKSRSEILHNNKVPGLTYGLPLLGFPLVEHTVWLELGPQLQKLHLVI